MNSQRTFASDIKKSILFLTTVNIFIGTIESFLSAPEEILNRGKSFVQILSPIAYNVGLLEVFSLSIFLVFLVSLILSMLFYDATIIYHLRDALDNDDKEGMKQILSLLMGLICLFSISISFFMWTDNLDKIEVISKILKSSGLPTLVQIHNSVVLTNPVLFASIGWVTLAILFISIFSVIKDTNAEM